MWCSSLHLTKKLEAAEESHGNGQARVEWRAGGCVWGKGEFHSRGSFAVTLLDTADVWCSKLPLANASLAATQPSLLACLPSTYASNRSVAATTTLLLFSLLPCVPLTVPFCRQKCCKFELNCESPTTALINFLLNTASALTKVYHFCRSKNLSIYGGKLYLCIKIV